jgi:replicative DNA helicase
MSIKKIIIDSVEAGRKGENKGYKTGINKLDEIIHNFRKSTYLLIGGTSGTGKTLTADRIIVSLLEQTKAVEINYYSLEIGPDRKFADLFSAYIKKKHGKDIPVKKLYGLGENQLLDDEYRLINANIDAFSELYNRISFKFYSELQVTTFEDELNDILLKNGDLSHGKELIYKQKNNKFLVTVIDHLSLVNDGTSDMNKKQMDDISNTIKKYRNATKMSFIVTQQLGDGLEQQAKTKKPSELERIVVGNSDLRDTRNSYHDCDIAILMFKPNKLSIEKWFKYTVTKNFVAAYVAKNRDGDTAILPMLEKGAYGVINSIDIDADNYNLKREEYYKQLK